MKVFIKVWRQKNATNPGGFKTYETPQLNPNDNLNAYGVAVAEAFVELLQKAGPNPTRDSLLAAYRHWNQANPFLIPGNIQHTDAKSQFPIRGEVIVKFGDGVFTPVSGLKIPKL